MSPFSAERRTLPAERRRGRGWPAVWVIGLIAVVVGVGAAAGFLLVYLNDPYRRLEEFPTASYLEDHRRLAGLKFRSELRVEADLGWKEGAGRLMVFTPKGETRPIAVFLPTRLADIFFNKGQVYAFELEVKEGGLIHANSCRKK